MLRPRPRLQHALRTAHYSLCTAHYALRTTHCSLLTASYALLAPHSSPLTTHCSLLTTHSLPGRGCSMPSRRTSPPSRRQTASWPSTFALAGSARLWKEPPWWGHVLPLRPPGTQGLGPGLLCAFRRRASAAQTPVAACGAASLPCPRPVYLLLPLTTYHLPPITYHSLRSTTCSQCRPISRRRPISQQPRWATHSPRSPLSPQHDRASSSPPPRSTRCASAGRAAAASQARAPPSPQACGRCSRQPRCSPTAPPTGAAAPACCNPMHQGLQPSELGLQPNVARAALTLTCVAGTAVSTRCVCY